MAATQVIIVYSPNQNLRRRVIVPEADSLIPYILNDNHLGEEYIVVSNDDYETYGPDALIGWHTMEIPASDRCVIVQNNQVTDVVLADPAIDTHPNGEIIQHDLAEPGWELKDDGTLHKPVIVPFSGISFGGIETA